MGVPKFYRWISERYPNMSRVINDNQIPDFDNFYLDMNGIIHACSHVNEGPGDVNVTEEEIFRNIFHYLDYLFRMIKPKKVFFMAIDGVAPRAKMNQQRARRFRAGKDRKKKLEFLAEKTGRSFQEISAEHFDTNAITPGTQFMANLDEQLRYFIHIKLTTDPLWEHVNVHLSGHLTPGEGEHKIMEFIRYTRSQSGYNVNTRHCLYGLDADLIMLGLVTHEMHFALLREEVKYGAKKISKIMTPEEITWHLLHTCLLRDYIDLEFRSMRDKLKFSYNLDRIVDDWILMAYLVGNDFIPHLPRIHINEEALTILWDTYKKILPTLDGYMNESGELNLLRFEIYLTELAKYDHQRYANENDSFKHLNKLNKSGNNQTKKKSQSDHDGFDLAILDKLNTNEKSDSNIETLDVLTPHENKLPDVFSLSDDNDLSSSSSTSENDSDDDNEDRDRKKTSSNVINDDDFDKMPLIEAEFRQHKNHYYRDKMKIDFISTDQLQLYVNQYIEALQWILKYYYQGCPSWSWFYPYHYAPYLSDLKNFKNLNLTFQQGTPFKPFEQLLSVLPPTSRQLLPNVLQSLMTDPNSPLLSFYPEDFQLDQNEKKHDWEAIVLLPFIDEELLLNSITKCYNQLNPIEQSRNQHIVSSRFITTSKLQPIGNFLRSNPYFPALKETRAICHEFHIDHYEIKFGRLEEKEMVNFPKFPILNVLPYKYSYKNSAVNLFESRSRETTLVLSLNHRPDSDYIKYNNQWNPKDKEPSSPFQISSIHPLIERYLGKRVFVNWPHFQYGIVCAISDFQHIYAWSNIPGGSSFYVQPINQDENQDFRNYIQTPIYVSYYPLEIFNDIHKKATYDTYTLNEIETQIEYTKAININRQYENRQGVSIGPIPILLYVSPFIGYRTKFFSNSEKCRIATCFSNQALAYPLQTTLFKLPNYRDDIEQIPQMINDYFKINDLIFALQSPYYSSLGYVQQINQDNHGKYFISCQMESSDVVNQPDIHYQASKLQEYKLKYFSAQQIAERLKIIPCVVSKITGKINVLGGGKRKQRANPTNIGLSWKMNKPVRQMYGYSKKMNEVWYYSELAIPIISEYITKFPEIAAEIERKPKDDNYFESHIWPEKKGKHELQQIRKWIKSLPTYSTPMMDGAWQVLDPPIINEVDKSVKAYYTKQTTKNPIKKTKIVSIDPLHLFKASELLGMCDPDIETTYCLFDRVVNVRLGTGVPIGTRGTVVGIMLGRTNLNTYYEVLFDNLPPNSLEAILLGNNQQKCCIKVRSYHLLNYSHSLRMRSMNNYRQRSTTSIHGWEQYSSEHTFRPPQQPTRNTRRQSAGNSTATKPKSAPPMVTNNKPPFAKIKEQTVTTNDPTKSMTSVENFLLFPPPVQLSSNTEIKPTPPTDLFLRSGSESSALFYRAIQDSKQAENLLPQTPMSTQRIWETEPTQYPPNPFISDNMLYAPPFPFEQGLLMYPPPPSQFQPFSAHLPIQSAVPPINRMGFDEHDNGTLPFSPSDLLLPGGLSVNPVRSTNDVSMPVSYQPQQFPMPTQNVPMRPSTSSLSYDAVPFQPQQTTPPHVTDRETVQFIPSQVLRNIPKKS